MSKSPGNLKTALVNGRIFDGESLHKGLCVVFEGDKISSLAPEQEIVESGLDRHDLQGHILAPGLVDIQVNGGGGVMFNDAPSIETIRTMGAAHRQFGTTGFLPTLISADSETMERAVDAVRQAISEDVPGVLGIHLEGPFLNPEYAGIHDAGKFCRLDERMFNLLTSLDGGRMLITLAPELTTPEMISRLSAQGVLVFGGHSSASYEQVRSALEAGLRGFTHLFNTMTPFGSREPGMVGAALEDRDSFFGIIADGHHVHPASFSVAVAAKRKGRALLVTDAMATVRSDQETFQLRGETVAVVDGCCRLPDGRLAGSDLDMITAVRNAAKFASIDHFEALRMASSYPAHALGLDSSLGFIKPGYRANLIELDDELNLYNSWIDGEVQEIARAVA